MNELELVVVRLTWADGDPDLPAAHLLRGALASRFPGNSLFHQHDADGLIRRQVKAGAANHRGEGRVDALRQTARLRVSGEAREGVRAGAGAEGSTRELHAGAPGERRRAVSRFLRPF